MTANRFGTDHFKGNYGDHKTLICRPPGLRLAFRGFHAPPGQKLALRNRFYFHHGDAETARVAEQYRAYAAPWPAINPRNQRHPRHSPQRP